MIVIAPIPAIPEPLAATLSVSLTVAEKDRIRAAANALGLSMSAYARRRLNA